MSIMVFSPQLSATSYGFKVYGVPIKFNSFLDAGLISDVSTGLVFHAPLSRQAKYALTSQKLTYSGSPSFGQVDGKWCATFNGENYVNFSTDNIPTGAGIRTMTAWVKCTGNSGERTVVIYGDANTSCSYGFSIWPEYRKIRLIGWDSDIDSADNSFSLNEWHLIVSTYDGSKYKGYIDCELVGEAVKSLNTTSNSSRHYIGGMGSDNPFIGSISDVRIYNRVLSDKDMKALFRMGPYDDSSSSSGSTSRFPEQVIFNMTQGFTGKFSGTFSKTNETTTVEGINYPVYSGHMYDYEMNSETEEWQVFSDYDTKLFACKVTDEADSSIIRYWWMFGSTALSENTIFDGYMGRGKYSTTEIPELTNEGWVDSAAMAYEYWTIDSSTITIVNGSSGGNQSSSSSDSGGSQPSQSVTKITITSSGSPADGEWTLNTSTGSYEKGGLRLECVQDALYAWQIWDREMPEYPDLYYSTGYIFQTNNVSEVLGTKEWHDVKLDDPISLTLTDTLHNDAQPSGSSSSQESSSGSGNDSSSSQGGQSGSGSLTVGFTGTYSEYWSVTYSGTFTQTNKTIDVIEWNTQTNSAMTTAYNVLSGSFHRVGNIYEWNDSIGDEEERQVDDYVTMWLVPAMNPPTYYEWLETDDKASWANDSEAMAPYYSWGIIEAADCGNEVRSTDGVLGYISEQRYTMPMIQTGDHVYSENAGGWDNTSITVN